MAEGGRRLQGPPDASARKGHRRHEEQHGPGPCAPHPRFQHAEGDRLADQQEPRADRPQDQDHECLQDESPPDDSRQAQDEGPPDDDRDEENDHAQNADARRKGLVRRLRCAGGPHPHRTAAIPATPAARDRHRAGDKQAKERDRRRDEQDRPQIRARHTPRRHQNHERRETESQPSAPLAHVPAAALGTTQRHAHTSPAFHHGRPGSIPARAPHGARGISSRR